MSCTTVLVGKRASYDGSTMISRTDDGDFEVMKTIVVEPDKQPRKYKSKISRVDDQAAKRLSQMKLVTFLVNSVDKSDISEIDRDF